MNTISCTRAACAAFSVLLVSCALEPTAVPSRIGQTGPYSPAPTTARSADSSQRATFHSVEAYKRDVAEQIMRYNAAHTFSGKLPPMLPAIVVLNITVDNDGKMTKVAVQRSRDNDASKVALASMQRTGALPKPSNLASGPGKSLTFSETFLFNADYRFQLRSLAPVQGSD
jgi:protein TonB